MSPFKFLEGIPIDVPNTLLQLLSRFQTVKDGLPELVKNAKDQYARVAISERESRPIVVIIYTRKDGIGVLDFAGATREDFRRWQTWSDPAANLAERAADIEGGHGNGGKAFMVRGSTTDAFLQSCKEGRQTKIGFDNEDPGRRFLPGYFIESGQAIDNVLLKDCRPVLDAALRGLSVKYDSLPPVARAAFEKRQAFTLAQVNGIKDWANRRPETVRRLVSEIADDLKQHPQAALSIETCSVWIVVDGKVIGSAAVKTVHPNPLPGFEKLAAVPVPDTLPDPETQEMVSTGEGDNESKFLQLRTSRRSLRMEDSRPLNVIRIRNARNIVDNWSVADLHSRAESAFIFGELKIPALQGDHLVGADRASGLADTQLVRALRRWASQHVEKLADQIQRANAKEHKEEDRTKANEGLKKLRDLMREFLELAAPGLDGPTPGSRGTDGPGTDRPPRPPIEYGATVHEIVLETGTASIAIAEGTLAPVLMRAYEVDNSGVRKPVRNVSFAFNVADEGIIELKPDGQIRGVCQGRTSFWFCANEVESNRVQIEVVRCTGAEIQNAPDRLLLQGERVPLRVVFGTAEGPRSDLLVDGSVDEPDRGRINRYGAFTAGGQEGDATIRVRYAAEAEKTTTHVLRIGPDRVPIRGHGGKEGGEIPYILLCGTPAPEMDHYPPEQRTVHSSEQLPTIIDYEPQFEHVIFLNPDSREAVQVRRGRGGRKGVASIGTETFLQFLALKCFEIVKRLYVRQSVKDGMMTEQQFRDYFATAEMDCAPFVDKAYSIARELANSEVEAI